MAVLAVEAFHNDVIGSQLLNNKQNVEPILKNVRTKPSIVETSIQKVQGLSNSDVQPPKRPPTMEKAPGPTEAKTAGKKKIKTGEKTLSRRGKFPTPAQLYKEMPQSRDRSYKAQGASCNILFVMVRKGWFDEQAWEGALKVSYYLCGIHPDYEAVLLQVPKLMKVDFSSLRIPRPNFASQTSIDKRRVWLMAACAVHYNMDIGLVVRYLGGEYLARWRDVEAIIGAVDGLISDEDLKHMRRILQYGCPANFNWEESDANKEAMLRNGNDRSMAQNMPVVAKTTNSEEAASHVVPLPRWVVRASPYARHTPQIVLPGKVNKVDPSLNKKPRLCWNGTGKRHWWWQTMNEITPIEGEALITFGYVYMSFCIWIWNLRISFPDEDILLAFIDISACFRWPRIAPCLVGAFGFVIGPLFFGANAMVFGSVASATSWEPFRRAIAALATSYFTRSCLRQTHKKYLDLIRWHEPPNEGLKFVQADKDSKNLGIIDDNGRERASPHNIYVDDNLMADTRRRLPQTLAAAIEAIFVIMGQPNLALRKCAVAMDKWLKLEVHAVQVLLGLLWNTRDMTVGTTPMFRSETCELLQSAWHEGREAFTVSEMEELVGKLGRIGQAYRPIYHLMPMMYASVAFGLRENDAFLMSTNKDYRKMIKRAKNRPEHQEDAREINFAIGQAARMVHASRRKYRMPKSLKEEIAFMRRLLMDETIELSTPIGHIVPRDPRWEQAADSCKRSGGGWSVDLKIWWHLVYPEEVIRRAYLENNKSGLLISINVLEMVCVIVNLASAIFICDHDGLDLATYPVLLNFCDNTAACAWVNDRCKHSLIGRRLGRLFIALLMSTRIGIQAEWIATLDNFIADDISRLRKASGDSDYEHNYAQLKETYPLLASCRQFQPSTILLGMIWDVLLNSASPDPLTLRKLAPNALGKIVS